METVTSVNALKAISQSPQHETSHLTLPEQIGCFHNKQSNHGNHIYRTIWQIACISSFMLILQEGCGILIDHVV